MPTPDLAIPSPCHEPWDAMSPAERGRRCAVCSTTVVDLIEAGPREARSRLAAAEAKVRSGERVCVRAHTDWTGRLLSPGVRRHLLTNGLAAIIAMAAAGCYAEDQPSCGGGSPDKDGAANDVRTQPPARDHQVEVGKIVVPPPVVGMMAPPPPKPTTKPDGKTPPDDTPDRPQPMPQPVTTGQLAAPRPHE